MTSTTSTTSTTQGKAQFGMIGLAVMGRSLALNVADHGFRVALYNRTPEVTDEVIKENPGAPLVATKSLPELVAALEAPRVIMILVKAGKPVDDLLDQLRPLLSPGDIVIDGGNTWFPETQRSANTWTNTRSTSPIIWLSWIWPRSPKRPDNCSRCLTRPSPVTGLGGSTQPPTSRRE